MMTLEEIKKKLETRNCLEVSKKSGVSYYLIRQIANGSTKNPSYGDVVKLINFLENDDG